MSLGPDPTIISLVAGADDPASRGSGGPEEPTLEAKLDALLNQIRALDKSMDEARAVKIANIKKALADGTYHVSADELARKLIDQL